MRKWMGLLGGGRGRSSLFVMSLYRKYQMYCPLTVGMIALLENTRE